MTGAASTRAGGMFPRLSDRFRVPDLALKVAAPNSRKLFGKKRDLIEMRVEDLSISGALLVGPEIDVLRAGARTPFFFGGEQGVLEIRHVRRAETSQKNTLALCGVAFIALPPEFEQLVFDHMEAERGGSELNDRWNRAH